MGITKRYKVTEQSGTVTFRSKRSIWSARVGETYTSRDPSTGGGYATVRLVRVLEEHQTAYVQSNNHERPISFARFISAYAVKEAGSPAPTRRRALDAAAVTVAALTRIEEKMDRLIVMWSK